MIHHDPSPPQPIWEAVKEEDVQTPREVFESIRDEGYAVEYLRIPVTDEQAPIPTVFDMLLNQVSQLDDTTDILFNCQMGYAASLGWSSTVAHFFLLAVQSWSHNDGNGDCLCCGNRAPIRHRDRVDAPKPRPHS